MGLLFGSMVGSGATTSTPGRFDTASPRRRPPTSSGGDQGLTAARTDDRILNADPTPAVTEASSADHLIDTTKELQIADDAKAKVDAEEIADRLGRHPPRCVPRLSHRTCSRDRSSNRGANPPPDRLLARPTDG